MSLRACSVPGLRSPRCPDEPARGAGRRTSSTTTPRSSSRSPISPTPEAARDGHRDLRPRRRRGRAGTARRGTRPPAARPRGRRPGRSSRACASTPPVPPFAPERPGARMRRRRASAAAGPPRSPSERRPGRLPDGAPVAAGLALAASALAFLGGAAASGHGRRSGPAHQRGPVGEVGLEQVGGGARSRRRRDRRSARPGAW